MSSPQPSASVAATTSDASLAEFPLAPILDMSSSQALHEALCNKIAGTQLRILSSAVERVSTACIQLLVAAAHEMEQRGGRCIFVAPSSALQDAFIQLGLEQELLQRQEAV